MTTKKFTPLKQRQSQVRIHQFTTTPIFDTAVS